MVDSKACLALLAGWARSAERWWYDWPEHRGLGCYGTGYNHWGVQTNQKYVAAMGVLATHPDAPDDVDRAWVLGRALSALRFSLASHVSGPATCTDGAKWGHTWISALGLERMMHAIPALRPHLSAQDQADLARVLQSEAEWLSGDYRRGAQSGIVADPWAESGKNHPESNIWNGALLWRTAVMYPEHPRASIWREQAHRFLINGVSVPADAHEERVVGGRAVKEWFVGANFFPSYALDHHGYLNVGYMVICVSNAAMLHFALKGEGLERPESLDHHQADLWRLVRRLIFADGRLARIGGDSRLRYTYCQEYLLPSLLYAADRWGDPEAEALVEAQLDLIGQEARFGGEGEFYAQRLDHLVRSNPYYYTRLESDRACALSQAVAFAPLVEGPAQGEAAGDSPTFAWDAPDHGAVMHRCPTRLASFAWRAYGLAQGMCQPPPDGHLTDWYQNLGGMLRFLGDNPAARQRRRLLQFQIEPFEGGFVTCGAVMEGTELTIPEGWRGTDAAVHRIAFCALPDGRTVIGLQHAAICAPRRTYVTEVKGLHLNLANDLYNGMERTLITEDGGLTIDSPAPEEQEIDLNSRWVNVDGRLGVVGLYGAEALTLCRWPERRGGDVPGLGSLFVEELNWHCQGRTAWAEPGQTILDVGWAVLSGADVLSTLRFSHANAGAAQAEDWQVGGQSRVRAVAVRGMDGKRYGLIANFSESPVSLPPAIVSAGRALGRSAEAGILLPLQARVWGLD